MIMYTMIRFHFQTQQLTYIKSGRELILTYWQLSSYERITFQNHFNIYINPLFSASNLEFSYKWFLFYKSKYKSYYIFYAFKMNSNFIQIKIKIICIVFH